MEYGKKGTLILTSLLEDLVLLSKGDIGDARIPTAQTPQGRTCYISGVMGRHYLLARGCSKQGYFCSLFGRTPQVLGHVRLFQLKTGSKKLATCLVVVGLQQ